MVPGDGFVWLSGEVPLLLLVVVVGLFELVVSWLNDVELLELESVGLAFMLVVVSIAVIWFVTLGESDVLCCWVGSLVVKDAEVVKDGVESLEVGLMFCVLGFSLVMGSLVDIVLAVVGICVVVGIVGVVLVDIAMVVVGFCVVAGVAEIGLVAVMVGIGEIMVTELDIVGLDEVGEVVTTKEGLVVSVEGGLVVSDEVGLVVPDEVDVSVCVEASCRRAPMRNNNKK